MSALLDVRGLRVTVSRSGGAPTTLVDGVDFHVGQGEIFGVAGESGSGKTISMLAILGLLPRGIAASGSAMFDEQELVGRRDVLARVRGRAIAMVFQNPMTSLHPMLTVEKQITEHMRHHLGIDGKAARVRAVELLERVRLPSPERALRSYPHQFSGGMRQRIAIAIALACRPRLLVADEPTTALDTTVQAGILRLLDELRRDTGMAVVLITHDLGVVAAIADRLMVLYSGRLAEEGPVGALIRRPRHPYTAALLSSLPESKVRRKVVAVPGTPPSPEARPSGCAFHPRCPHSQPGCDERVPPALRVEQERLLACPVDPL